MSCCEDPKHHRPYRADTASGWAVACKKCGRARPATPQEAEAAQTVGEAR